MSENKQDTITVDLPIEADGPDAVRVSTMRLTRESWRVAANGGGDWAEIVRHLAPAVVAWIERDEWEPLDVPEVGRKIKATLRDGREVTLDVLRVDHLGSYVGVETCGALHFIESEPDGAAATHPRTIIAWEYVDEAAVDLAAIADKIAAAVNELREAIG